MKKEIEVKGCVNCLYLETLSAVADRFWCKYYDSLVQLQGINKPDWCKVKKITVEEEG